MNTLALVLLIILINLAGAAVLMKHRRNARHHRASMPVIGSDPRLTEVLHKRLRNSPPHADWLSPAVMRMKIAAWMRKGGAQ